MREVVGGGGAHGLDVRGYWRGKGLNKRGSIQLPSELTLWSSLFAAAAPLLLEGDATGSLLWGTAMYYASPLQLLLLFLGKIDTERPSDWVLRQIGVAAGLP